MSVTTTNFLTLADNIAKTIVDLKSAYITTPASTVTNIQNGQNAASNSLVAHVSAFGLSDQAGTDLANYAQKAASAIVAETTISENPWYEKYVDVIRSLMEEIGDIGDYIRVNNLVVHPEFANCINHLASLGKVDPPGVILATLTFPAAEQSLATIAVTGAAAGTFAAGTDYTNLAIESQLYIKNTAGVSSVGTATSFTITYDDNTGTSHQVTQALSGALAAGATLAAGTAKGVKVTAITVNSGGSAGDTFAVTIEPARTVAY